MDFYINFLQHFLVKSKENFLKKLNKYKMKEENSFGTPTSVYKKMIKEIINPLLTSVQSNCQQRRGIPTMVGEQIEGKKQLDSTNPRHLYPNDL